MKYGHLRELCTYLYGRISRGHPDNVSFMQFSTKIDSFEQKYSQGFENSYNSDSVPIREIFDFHQLPKLYYGFKIIFLMCG